MKRVRSHDDDVINDVDLQPKLASLDSAQPSPDQLITCNLPPFCHIDPLQFVSLEQFESHYHRFHSYRCSVCHKVFPSEIILELHITECHDAFAGARQARGEKIVSNRSVPISLSEYGVVYWGWEAKEASLWPPAAGAPPQTPLLLSLRSSRTSRVSDFRLTDQYGCLVEGCDRFCSTAQKRRRHVIDKHGYPPQFDFKIIEYGLSRNQNSLLRQ
ncbi:hypothetical protein AWJ20_5328 [Sugiyamaella lignohabitans]|uniref:C2H2-type domain-containing protein n=1 Tax=Sugiyamaella lignohabitans TaxID=796027 RepID=A0A161HLP5_9ASCO|nr:uncharacterized protein AWJ20_5328 [Sugiyamaella lignohabitans]ANB14357.1 hypothetical protein AWJ20_5328 [Sugiyamaella lignohabitans]